MSQFSDGLIRHAIEVASCGSSDDLPIAAVLADRFGSVIASSRNAVIQSGEATSHAELLVIRSLDLSTFKCHAENMTLAVTLEPCPMCAWAIRSVGIGRVIFGAYNPQYGAAGSVYDLLRDGRHGRSVEVVGGVLKEECQQLLDDALSDMRNNGAR